MNREATAALYKTRQTGLTNSLRDRQKTEQLLNKTLSPPPSVPSSWIQCASVRGRHWRKVMPAVFHPHCSVAEEGLGMNEFWLYVWLRKVGIVAAHIISLGLTIFITLLSRPGTSLFSWHPVCMSIGFSLCMTEGVLLFSSEGSPFCFQSRKSKVQLHWVLQALVVIAGGTGLGFIVASKNVSERPHLTSWHSLLGVATLVAAGCQALCGVCLLFPKRVSSVARLRLYHATCGLVTYLLATGTLVLAMCSDWFQGTIKGALWYVCVLLPLCPALVVMNQITNAYLPTYQRRRSRYESDHI